MAPNLITFIGFLLTVVNFPLIGYYDFDFTAANSTQKVIPDWVWIVASINIFVAYTLGIEMLFSCIHISSYLIMETNSQMVSMENKHVALAPVVHWVNCSTMVWIHSQPHSYPFTCSAYSARMQSRRFGCISSRGTYFWISFWHISRSTTRVWCICRGHTILQCGYELLCFDLCCFHCSFTTILILNSNAYERFAGLSRASQSHWW